MPEELTSYNWNRRLRNNYGSRFDHLTDGKTYKLINGKDFESTSKSARSQLYSLAKRRGMKCRVQLDDDDNIIVQFYHDEEQVQDSTESGPATDTPSEDEADVRSLKESEPHHESNSGSEPDVEPKAEPEPGHEASPKVSKRVRKQAKEQTETA